MKLLHTADWHLGKVIFSRSLLESRNSFSTKPFFRRWTGRTRT